MRFTPRKPDRTFWRPNTNDSPQVGNVVPSTKGVHPSSHHAKDPNSSHATLICQKPPLPNRPYLLIFSYGEISPNKAGPTHRNDLITINTIWSRPKFPTDEVAGTSIHRAHVFSEQEVLKVRRNTLDGLPDSLQLVEEGAMRSSEIQPAGFSSTKVLAGKASP